MKIFYSWQSDRPLAVCKHFIRDAVSEALAQLHQTLGLEDAERPELDHDVKNTAGWAEITNTILQKIAACAVFIADVTAIAKTADHGKEVPNPNVALELGYALRAVGGGRIVPVVNTAYGGTSPEKLPFNMRHRSKPVSYKLKKDASEAEQQEAKTDLVAQLVDWIGGCLKEAMEDRPAPEIPWRAEQPGDPGIWFDKAIGLKHQGHFGRGMTTVTLEDGPRDYVRMLPSGWTTNPPSRDQVHAAGNNLAIYALGRWQNGDGGLTSEGVLAYSVIDNQASPRPTTTLTQYFKDTGEIWGVDAYAIVPHNGQRWLTTTSALHQWAVFVGRRLALYHHFGAKAPIHIRIGITDLEGSIISSFNQPAIDASFEYRDMLKDFSVQEQKRFLIATYNKMREAYGVGPAQSFEGHVTEIDALLFHPPV